MILFIIFLEESRRINWMQQLIDKASPPTKELYPIKTYLKIYSSSGDPNDENTSNNHYEILDENTVMEKKENYKFVMHPFAYIFSAKIGNHLVSGHIFRVEDCFEGVNQSILVGVQDEKCRRYVSTGTVESNGCIFEVAQKILREAKEAYHATPPRVYFSIFASIEKANRVIDLITGQILSFFCKKDIDHQKDFLEVEVTSLREFLILMKISQIRYEECCKKTDTLVYKIMVDSQGEASAARHFSTLHFIVSEIDDKVYGDVIKMVRLFASEDKEEEVDFHGCLSDYFHPFIRNSKIILLNALLNKKAAVLQAIPHFQPLTALSNKALPLSRNRLAWYQGKETEPHRDVFNSSNSWHANSFSSKELSALGGMLQNFRVVQKECKDKLNSYYDNLKEIQRIRTEFYEREKFPVSLEIRDECIKSFFSSKVYMLCENFQMEDVEGRFSKLNVEKNRILIALKSLLRPKHPHSQTLSPDLLRILKKYENSVKAMRKDIQTIFALSFREIEILVEKGSVRAELIFSNQWLLDLGGKLKSHKSQAGLCHHRTDSDKISLVRVKARILRNEVVSDGTDHSGAERCRGDAMAHNDSSALKIYQKELSAEKIPSNKLSHSLHQQLKQNSFHFHSALNSKNQKEPAAQKKRKRVPTEFSLPKIEPVKIRRVL